LDESTLDCFGLEGGPGGQPSSQDLNLIQILALILVEMRKGAAVLVLLSLFAGLVIRVSAQEHVDVPLPPYDPPPSVSHHRDRSKVDQPVHHRSTSRHFSRSAHQRSSNHNHHRQSRHRKPSHKHFHWPWEKRRRAYAQRPGLSLAGLRLAKLQGRALPFQFGLDEQMVELSRQ
jgi:hypothetical protein